MLKVERRGPQDSEGTLELDRRERTGDIKAQAKPMKGAPGEEWGTRHALQRAPYGEPTRKRPPDQIRPGRWLG